MRLFLKLFKYLFFTVIFLILIISTCWTFNRHEPQPDARYSGISLTLEPSPSSPLLNEFVAVEHQNREAWDTFRELFRTHEQSEYARLRDAAQAGQDDRGDPGSSETPASESPSGDLPEGVSDGPSEVPVSTNEPQQETLWSKLNNPHQLISAYRAAIQDPGCLDDLKRPLNLRISWRRLISGASLIELYLKENPDRRSPEELAQEQLIFLQALERKRSHCAHSIVSHFIFANIAERTHAPLLRLISNPTLSSTLRGALISFYRTLMSEASHAARVSALQQSFRVEHTVTTAHFTQTMRRSLQQDFGVQSLWPLLDLEQLSQWQAESARAWIWVSGRTPTLPPSNELAIERFASQIELPWLYLSYNPIGQVLFAVAHSEYRLWIDRSHEGECRLAWEVARALAPLDLEPPFRARNPFTGQLLDLSVGELGERCERPSAEGGDGGSDDRATERGER